MGKVFSQIFEKIDEERRKDLIGIWNSLFNTETRNILGSMMKDLDALIRYNDPLRYYRQ